MDNNFEVLQEITTSKSFKTGCEIGTLCIIHITQIQKCIQATSLFFLLSDK